MTELGNLFNKFKCDKTAKHQYEKVYEPVLESLMNRKIKILEVGVFNGYSTEAFMQYLPLAEMYGLDIFTRTRAQDLPCYESDRADWIKASSIDPSIGRQIKSKWGNIKFDVIIDDGLHTPKANMQTFKNLAPFLADDGVYFIEDVFPMEIMTPKELAIDWIQRHPDRYNHLDNNMFLNALDKSDMKIKRHDQRKLTKQPDSYIVELRK
jgi:predicted O-methyltransferase YrrM